MYCVCTHSSSTVADTWTSKVAALVYSRGHVDQQRGRPYLQSRPHGPAKRPPSFSRGHVDQQRGRPCPQSRPRGPAKRPPSWSTLRGRPCPQSRPRGPAKRPPSWSTLRASSSGLDSLADSRSSSLSASVPGQWTRWHAWPVRNCPLAYLYLVVHYASLCILVAVLKLWLNYIRFSRDTEMLLKKSL